MTENNTFHQTIKEIETNSRVYLMHNYIQHGSITTYDHCISVAREAFNLNRRLHMHTDEKRLVRAAFLHDYFLYDWHDHGDKLHGYHHPKIAAENAVRDFHITEHERRSIASHMWPLNILTIPASREAWLITIADKICSSEETLLRR